jgi:release factor glutamine methyltransferase
MKALPTTVGAALALARACGLDRTDSLLLLSHATRRPRTWLIAHDDATLTPGQATGHAALCQRRAAGEPVAYLLGEREFHGLLLQVTPAVLVPRPDTETLVDWALELLVGALADRSQPAVLDLGTGSGAIALALKHRHASARLTALDASEAALTVARANGERLGLAVDWRHSDWWQSVAGERFDLTVSNPPYIAEGDVHLAALRHEPINALTPGGDGLDAFRHICAGAGPHLRPGAWMLFEHGFDQAEAVRALLASAGFEAVCSRSDLSGLSRCSGGRWTGSPDV